MSNHIFIDIGLFIWVAAAGWGLGATLFRVLKVKNFACGEDIFKLAVGMGILSHLTLLLGIALPLKPSLTWGLLGAGGIAFLGMLYVERGRVFQKITIPRLDGIEVILIILIVASLVYVLGRNALLPPLTYDEVAYHMAIPKIYIQQQHISYISFIPFSNWPLETEMLFLLGLLVGSEIFSHLITWGAMVLVCIALVVFGNHFFSRRAGLVAALIFSATPMVTSIAGTGLIEVPLTLFVFLAFASFLLWIRERQPKYWILSALLAGFAASIKFNAAVMAAILAVLVVAVSFWRKEGWRTVIKRFIGFGVLAFLVVSVWYIKSWFQTGNPFWPLFLNIFPTRNWDALASSYLFGFLNKPNLPLTVPNFFNAFWLISADYAKIGPYVFRLGWVYLAGIPLVGLGLWKMEHEKRRWLTWIAVISVILYINWFFLTHQARFFMPAVPVMALAIGAGASALMQRWKHPLAMLGLASVVVGIVAVNSWVFQPQEIAELRSNKAYLIGIQDRAQFLTAHASFYDAYAFANSDFPSNAKVLLALWENRGYYLDRPYMWLNPMCQRIFKLEDYQNDDQLAADLTQMDFTYILYNTQFTDQFLYIQYGPHQAQLIRDLLQNHARLLYTAGEIEVYQFFPSIITKK